MTIFSMKRLQLKEATRLDSGKMWIWIQFACLPVSKTGTRITLITFPKLQTRFPSQKHSAASHSP